jgi:class 3 adenylate cyclase
VIERRLGEERKRVTVVFADLAGFTAQAERLDPEDVRGVLAPFHAFLRDELERHGGTVERFIGDAVRDATPTDSPWIEAARAIGAGDPLRAAAIIEGIGHTVSAAYARRRAELAFGRALGQDDRARAAHGRRQGGRSP